MKQTPEQRAEAAYPMEDDAPDHDSVLKQRGYLTCIREEVEPLEAELIRLRAFIDKFIPAECWGIDTFDGGEVQDVAVEMGILVKVNHAQPCQIEECSCEGSDYLYHTKWTARSQGFVPTNTTEG
jgi:hypothetical protein